MKKATIIIVSLAIFFSILLILYVENQQKNMLPLVGVSDDYPIVSATGGYITHRGTEDLSTYFKRFHNLFLTLDYSRNHPNQSIILFPWEPSTSMKVLPFDYEIPVPPSNNLSLTASRNQYEAGSFIITAQKDLSGIEIKVPDLYNTQGNRIPADAIDVRLVKVWYQAGEGSVWISTPGKYLTPELLLKDDTLVRVDYVNKTNYLKVTENGVQHYIDISDPNGTFPDTAEIYDTASLQPFSLATNENKQIWLTVHVPDAIPSGDYYGDIIITTQSEAPVLMNLKVTVLPFDLEPPPIEYAIYYTGKMPQGPLEGINNEWKTPRQYALELKDMKDHGIAYPTLFEYEWNLETALAIRNQSGLPKDHIYLHDGIETGNATSQTDLIYLENQITHWKNTTSHYGYQTVYIYGIDEARGEVLQSERPAWETVHLSGGKVYAAVSDNQEAVTVVGDLLDVAVFAGLNTTQAAQWHRYGQKIFLYANPETGVEDPEIYRRNYGYVLWNAGYDGEMIYAYQSGFGQSIWNDFDDPGIRDHVFAYPTSNGVIDTIQWEGFREGVDDTRYLATLKKYGGTDTAIRALVNDSLSSGEDMATLRKKVITQILTMQY